jgi:site-specific DNA-methyltransferase (adenine-specific)
MAPPVSHQARVETNKSASRFFYCAKASKSERGTGNNHPTVKPIKLLEYLYGLVTPPGGLVLDPFFGSGTTGLAALQKGFQIYGIENDPVSYFTAKARILRSIDPEQLV